MKYANDACSNYDCPLKNGCQLFLNYLEDLKEDEVILSRNLKEECENNNFKMYKEKK